MLFTLIVIGLVLLVVSATAAPPGPEDPTETRRESVGG